MHDIEFWDAQNVTLHVSLREEGLFLHMGHLEGCQSPFGFQVRNPSTNGSNVFGVGYVVTKKLAQGPLFLFLVSASEHWSDQTNLKTGIIYDYIIRICSSSGNGFRTCGHPGLRWVVDHQQLQAIAEVFSRIDHKFDLMQLAPTDHALWRTRPRSNAPRFVTF